MSFQRSIYVTSSRDGTEYAAPKKVAEVESLMLGMRRGPRIAATKSAVIVSAIGKVGDILCWRSEDNGEHWTPAATINDAPGAAREGLFNLAAGPEDQSTSNIAKMEPRQHLIRSDEGPYSIIVLPLLGPHTPPAVTNLIKWRPYT